MYVGVRDMGKRARLLIQETYMKFINGIWRDRSGATAIEYALICAFIAIAAATAIQGIGSQVTDTFNTTSSGFTPG